MAPIVLFLSQIPIRVGIDNETVVTKGSNIIHILQQNPTPLPPSHWATQSDGDLWEIFEKCVLTRGPSTMAMQKVKGHAKAEHTQEGIATEWTKKRNAIADRMAQEGAERHKRYIAFCGAVHAITHRVHLAHTRLRLAPVAGQNRAAQTPKIRIDIPIQMFAQYVFSVLQPKMTLSSYRHY